MIFLPRQARDKHRENSKKDAVFRTGDSKRLPRLRDHLMDVKSRLCPSLILIEEDQSWWHTTVALSHQQSNG
jgi:hypothetical protein